MPKLQPLSVFFELKLKNSDPVCGEGVIALLEGVESSGSLSSACQSMLMAYSKAWRIVRETEKRLGARLILSAPGGKTGGGSSLTPIARELVARFRAVQTELEACGEILSNKYLAALDDLILKNT